MLLKLIQCLKFWILSMVIGLSLLARRGRRSWSLQEGIGPLKEEGDWRRECRRQGRHGSIRERIYNEEEDVSLSKHEIYMELLYFWLLSEWLSTPGKITIFLYLLIRAYFFQKRPEKGLHFAFIENFSNVTKKFSFFMYLLVWYSYFV